MEDKYELISVNNGVITIEQEVISTIQQYNELKKVVESYDKGLRKELFNAMERNGIKKYDNDVFSATYKDGYIRTSVDTEKMKIDGIYDDYTKDVFVEPSVMLRFK